MRPYTLSKNLGIGVRFLRSLRSDRTVRTRSLRKLNHFFCLMRNFSLYGGDRSPPISYMSCNSLSTSNCLLSKIDAIQKEDARENSKRSCMPSEALMGDEGFHLLLHSSRRSEGGCLLRKEVIQPLVPQRLPCYDFIPITTHTLGGQMPDFGCRRLS